MQPEKLILIIDSDTEWSIRIASQLLVSSFKTAIALNTQQALEMIAQLPPQVIVLNIDEDTSNPHPVIAAATKITPKIPVICLTERHTFNSPELSMILRQGAFDCLIKPCTIDILIRKIQLAAQTSTPTPATSRYQEFSLFIDRIKQLNITRNPEQLIDTAFEYFNMVTRADSAVLFVHSSDKRSWKKVRTRQPGDLFPDDTTLDNYCRQLAVTGQSVVDTFHKRATSPRDAGTPLTTTTSILAIPIMSGNDLLGTVILQRLSAEAPFLQDDLEAANIIAGQVGSAMANIHLYDTVNQKLTELQVISSYSEKLMGMVDKLDILRSLCETAVHHIGADMTGVFIVQRRAHEFLHWSRYTVSEKMLNDFCNETIEVFNRTTESTLRKRRINYTPLKIDKEPAETATLPPLAFRYVVPLCWDDLKFGAIIIASVNEPEHISSKLAMLSSIVGQTHIALTNTKLYSDMKENYIRTIKALAIAVDAKDTYTHGHSENVMNIAESIARELSIDDEMVSIIRDAGLLHDIGKIGIPGYILNKPGPLTYEEFNGIMKTHSTLGANIVRDVPFLRDLYKLILYHHEHYDGNGYPDGLKGEQIPLGARILHVADAFEAMTSDRPYRMSLGQGEALHRLSEGSGTQFDPAIIAAFLRVAKNENMLRDLQPDHPFNLHRV